MIYFIKNNLQNTLSKKKSITNIIYINKKKRKNKFG